MSIASISTEVDSSGASLRRTGGSLEGNDPL
jgi:hypothetical protein